MIIDPGQNLECVKSIWVFVAVDDKDNESVFGVGTAHGMMPAVFADSDLMYKYKEIFKKAAQDANKGLKLVRFTNRENLEVLNEITKQTT